MEYKKKLEKIKFNKLFYPKQDNIRLEEDITVYETAIEELEKQLPKKLIEYNDGTLHCPICEKDMTRLGFNVCIECYQRLRE